MGLAEGILQVRNKCLYLDDLLLIWPEDYAITTVDGRGAVVGDGWTASPGQKVSLGGGQYELVSELPSGGGSASIVPCPGPYMWVSEILGVEA